MGRRKRQPEQSSISRRAFLRTAGIGAAAMAVGAGIYISIPHSFNFSFLDAQFKFEPIVFCEEPGVVTLDAKMQREFADHVQKDPRIKQEWWVRSKVQPANLTYNKVTRRHAYVPEQNAQWANAYLDYCIEAMGEAWKKCGFSKDIIRPIICGTESPPVESAGIVNVICDVYNVDVTLSAPGVPSLKTGYEMARNEHTRGGFRTQVKYDPATKAITALKASPLLLTTTGTKYDQLFTPFPEALHWILAPATKKSIEAIGPEGISNLEEHTNQCVYIDEAVAHGVGHVLFADFAKKHKLPLTEKDFEEGINVEKRFARYATVPIAMEYARKTGADLVKRYLDNPFEVRKKIESGSIRW